MNLLLPILSALVVSMVSVIAIIPLLLKKKMPEKVLLILLSVSVGVLLAIVFVEFVPELVADSYTIGTVIYIIVGFLFMFIVEKFVHSHHHNHAEKIHHHKHDHKHDHDHDVECQVHGHAYHLAPLNLIGEGFHNFIDGLVIAGSYAVSVPLGIGATISIILHEIPMEVADFGILLYSGMSKVKALAFNLLSALFAVLGVVVGMLLIDKISSATGVILAIATGNFLYIAASSLVPQLHGHHGFKDTILHLIAIIIGVGIIIALALYGPGHTH